MSTLSKENILKYLQELSVELCDHIYTAQQKPMHWYIINISLPNLEKTKFVFAYGFCSGYEFNPAILRVMS
jgi:hypothetical protein